VPPCGGAPPSLLPWATLLESAGAGAAPSQAGNRSQGGEGEGDAVPRDSRVVEPQHARVRRRVSPSPTPSAVWLRLGFGCGKEA
jgi:hypothetical protein